VGSNSIRWGTITYALRISVLALCVSASAWAQSVSSAPEISTDGAKVDHYPAHDVRFPNGVRGISGIVYSEPNGYRALTLDLYHPPNSLPRPKDGFPLVLYIHGGGWLAGNARRSVPFVDFPGVLASLSSRGYVVASIEYRLSGEAKFPAQVEDVKAAIRWLRLHASTYDVDASRFMTWGVSAGGYLSGFVAVDCNKSALDPSEWEPSSVPDATAPQIMSSTVSDCVQGAVSWYGVFDFATIGAQAQQDKAMSRENPQAPEWQLLGCFGNSKCDPKRIAAASPVTYVDRNDPPILLIAGTEDTLVPYQQTLEMAERLKATGAHSELIVLPGVNHSFIGKTPAQTRDANLKALDATFRFIDRTMKNAH
jgi:acetyl esterase/lipase